MRVVINLQPPSHLLNSPSHPSCAECLSHGMSGVGSGPSGAPVVLAFAASPLEVGGPDQVGPEAPSPWAEAWARAHDT